MKKLLIGFSIVGLSFISVTQAQTTSTISGEKKGFYVGIGGGYNLPITTKGSSFYETYIYTNPSTGPNSREVTAFSLGKGANFGVDLGYMFTSHIGAELGIDYLLGSKTTIAEFIYENNPDYSHKQTLAGKMVQFKPAVVFRAGNGAINPYAKLGIVVGVGTKIKSENQEREPDNENFTYDRNVEFTGGTAVGFHGALGVDYSINDKISLFGEITGVGLNYSPNKGKLTKEQVNNYDILPDLDVIDKEIEFVDEITQDDNEDYNKPYKANKFSVPFSSVGINIGARFHF